MTPQGTFCQARAAILFFTLLFVTSSSLLAQEKEKKKYFTAEEIAQTEAGKLFVTRRFEEALEEFKKLSRQYPKDIVIKRYIGACLDHLQKDDEAIQAFKEVLKLDPADFPSHQFLGKIYLRKADLKKAEEEFTYIVENDRTGTFAPAARQQLEAIKRLRATAEKVRELPGREISPQEFLETRAAQLFMNAKYEEALRELGELEKRYPQDVLVKRYQGITLDKLRRFDEAIQAFQAGLAIVPESIPLHFFLGQALLHKGDFEGARREFQYVVDHDETKVYQVRAQAELEGIKRILEARKPPKRWTVKASSGGEWNYNPTSTSMFGASRTNQRTPAAKISSSVGTSYEFWRKAPWSAKVSYDYSQSMYTSSVSEINVFSNVGGVTATYSKTIKGKPLTVQAGHSTTYTMVRNKYYSTTYAQSLSLVYWPRDRWRLGLNEKWSFSAYESDGLAPDSTGRDGFANVAGFTNHFFQDKEKTRYATFGFDYGREDTQGINYIKDIFTFNTGLHFPLLFKFEADVNYKYKFTHFPKYGFPAPHTGRQDGEHGLGVTVSRKISKYWTLKGNYNFTHVDSRDGKFAYVNHAVGGSLSYNY